ncbi:MAG: hypothetical protein HYX40_04075 [Sphingobacteriales bacterium]|nr:hypothetical protein [Sphingobacteriales bacterium]
MNKFNSSHSPLLASIISNFFARLRQSPTIYPIRFYKKGKSFRRHWQGPLVK